jgi:protein PhnA
MADAAEETPIVRDTNGNLLAEGDTVTIIKDLPVKGAGFTAKQGTTVKNIHLVPSDPTHIEGRVNGTKIFLKTEFLKKA